MTNGFAQGTTFEGASNRDPINQGSGSHSGSHKLTPSALAFCTSVYTSMILDRNVKHPINLNNIIKYKISKNYPKC